MLLISVARRHTDGQSNANSTNMIGDSGQPAVLPKQKDCAMAFTCAEARGSGHTLLVHTQNHQLEWVHWLHAKHHYQAWDVYGLRQGQNILEHAASAHLGKTPCRARPTRLE
eukprot:scpid101595/ scgid15914/ 